MKAAESAPGPQQPPRRRGRPADGRQPLGRDEIVEAALTAIRRIGPAASMDDIAAEAGVTKPIVYRTVGDRSKIVRAVSEYLVAEVDRNTVGRFGDAMTVEEFRSAVRRLFQVLERERHLWMYIEMGRDGTDTERLIDNSAQYYAKSLANNRASADQPEWRRYTWAVATVGALQTAARMWTAEPYCDLDEVVDDVVAFVLNARGVKPPSKSEPKPTSESDPESAPES